MRCRQCVGIILIVLLSGLLGAGRATAEPGDFEWLLDYKQAMDTAREEGKMMFILFHQPSQEEAARQIVALLEDEQLQRDVQRHVWVKLPLTQTVPVKGEQIRLTEHGAFAELRRQSGVAIIDMTSTDSPHYGYVVSVYPFPNGRSIGPKHLAALLELPNGSLTQRTLVFAVRVHPEMPASASGSFDVVLAKQTERHSLHQASIRRQGHHNWQSRFHQINAQLPNHLVAQEVCAESWAGQGLLAAAIECVASWRQSSGHWDAVRRRHPRFGYDMKRGRNGVWYATGIFGRRR